MTGDVIEFTRPLNHKEPDKGPRGRIKGYSDPEIAWTMNGGVRQEGGRSVLRNRMSDETRRIWLTGAHAKGEIDDMQLRRFWPGKLE